MRLANAKISSSSEAGALKAVDITPDVHVGTWGDLQDPLGD
jgi:hypothetical protein